MPSPEIKIKSQKKLEDWQTDPKLGPVMWEHGLTFEDIENSGGCLHEAIRLKKLGYEKKLGLDK